MISPDACQSLDPPASFGGGAKGGPGAALTCPRPPRPRRQARSPLRPFPASGELLRGGRCQVPARWAGVTWAGPPGLPRRIQAPWEEPVYAAPAGTGERRVGPLGGRSPGKRSPRPGSRRKGQRPAPSSLCFCRCPDPALLPWPSPLR